MGECEGERVKKGEEINGGYGKPLTTVDNTDPNDPRSRILTGGTLVATTSTDCDGDGVTNADEINGPDGLPATTGDNTDPNDACDYNPTQITLAATSTGDCDMDGVPNNEEINGPDGDPSTTGDNTDPHDPCDPNATAVALGDCDEDGNPNGSDPNPETPVAVDDSGTVPVGNTTVINILDNDDFLENNDPANLGTTEIVILPSGTAGGTTVVDAATGQLSYTPLAPEAGSDVTIDYLVCNTAASPIVCDTATVTITVNDQDIDGDGVGDSVDAEPSNHCIPDQPIGYTGFVSSNPTWAAVDCDGDNIQNGEEFDNYSIDSDLSLIHNSEPTRQY